MRIVNAVSCITVSQSLEQVQRFILFVLVVFEQERAANVVLCSHHSVFEELRVNVLERPW
jgi:hypothetical protein